MSNENQGSRPLMLWEDIALFKDEKTGMQVRLQKNTLPVPQFSLSIGFSHKQTGALSAHSRHTIPFHKPQLKDMKIFDPVIEGLLALRDQINNDSVAAAQALEATVPKPRQHHDKPNRPHKPGQPGKTGKTARKKAAIQAARQPNGTPPATS